jgi:hypothetical protein
MGIDAAALLKIPRAKLVSHFQRDGEETTEIETMYRGANGFPFRVTSAGDAASIVWTSISFRSEPDELGLGFRKILGDVLDQHHDARGILALPDVADPRGKSYDAVVDEIGEAGMWAPRVASDYVPKRLVNAQPGSFEASVRDMLAAFPPDMIQQMERAMATGDPNAMPELQSQMMGILASNPQLLEQLQSSLSAITPAHSGFPGGFPGMGEMPSEEEAAAIHAQAREHLEQLKQTNPEMYEQLRAQFEEIEDDDNSGGEPEPPAEPPSSTGRGPSKKK